MSTKQQEVRLIRGQGFDDKDPSIIRDYNNYDGPVGCLFFPHLLAQEFSMIERQWLAAFFSQWNRSHIVLTPQDMTDLTGLSFDEVVSARHSLTVRGVIKEHNYVNEKIELCNVFYVDVQKVFNEIGMRKASVQPGMRHTVETFKFWCNELLRENYANAEEYFKRRGRRIVVPKKIGEPWRLEPLEETK